MENITAGLFFALIFHQSLNKVAELLRIYFSSIVCGTYLEAVLQILRPHYDTSMKNAYIYYRNYHSRNVPTFHIIYVSFILTIAVTRTCPSSV